MAAARGRCSPARAPLLGLALINPDAWIAEQNLDRYAETGNIDWAYIPGCRPTWSPLWRVSRPTS